MSRQLTSPGRSARAVSAVLCGGLAAQTFRHLDSYREYEAAAGAHLLNALTSTPASTNSIAPIVWTGSGNNLHGFTVTLECSSALIVGSLAAITAIIALGHRRPVNVLVALGAGALVVVVANLLRLLTVIGCTRTWGDPGYVASHTYVGTAITLAGVVVAAAVFVTMLGRGRTKDLPTRRAHAAPRR